MRYTPTPLAGAFVLDLERIEDPRDTSLTCSKRTKRDSTACGPRFGK